VGEKLGTVMMAYSMSFSGIFFAFFRGWMLTFFLLFYFPVVFGMAYIITVAFSKGYKENMKAYNKSAGYAE
jgi:ABC-type multidrug transport system fused ATPase/permease subunit